MGILGSSKRIHSAELRQLHLQKFLTDTLKGGPAPLTFWSQDHLVAPIALEHLYASGLGDSWDGVDEPHGYLALVASRRWG